MVADRNDWCISRQRTWGVPIPIFYCEDCGESLITHDTIEKVAQLFEKEGSGAWFKYEPKDIIGDLAVCPKCGCTHMRKEKDIMDVWFDSGSSYAYVLDKMLGGGDNFPADLYLEGNDQYRGWFQSSLLTSVSTRGCSPYKTVLTHGMIIDLEGRKMSKSLGNGIDPSDVVKQYGADILRLWVSSVDYTTDARISNEILKQMAEVYRKIRNTARIMLANLGKGEDRFDPNTDMVAYDELYDIDKWILSRLNKVVKEVTDAYENYEFHLIYHALGNFCTIDLSNLYIDITKDRVYVEGKTSKARRSAQTAMYIVLSALTRMLSPLIAFTAEEIWDSMPHLSTDDTRSVSLNDMPKVDTKYDFADEERWNKLFDFRTEVMKALEVARADKLIGKSLDAKVAITTSSSETYDLLCSFASELETVFIVSQVEIAKGDSDKIEVSAANGKKCDRCWKFAIEGDSCEDGFLCARCSKIISELEI